MDVDVIAKPARSSLLLGAVAWLGASAAQAQTVLELKYPSNAPGTTPCLYTTNALGISADPQSGNLQATGDFSTGCPQTGSALPLPVIVPGPADWALPLPWAIGQAATVQWAAVNATSCTYGGSSATGWPSGTLACSGTACQTLKTISISPPAAGTYQFSLSCSNATGSSAPSISESRVVAAAVVQPVITGPASWGTLQPWSAGGTKSVSWSATNADSCSLSATTLPAGVTLAQFTGGGSTSCNSAGSCAAAHPLTLTAPVAGNYGLLLSCSNNTGGSGTSINSWTVAAVGESCVGVAGWNRLTTGQIFHGNGDTSQIGLDLTTFESIWGRDYSILPNSPITTNWPGLTNILAAPKLAAGEYVAAKFRTPSGGGVVGTQFTVDPSTYSFAGGGNGTNGKMSFTVSTVCGDFNTSSSSIPQGCWKNQMGTGDFLMYTNQTSGSSCRLSPNTDYYFNLIFSPIGTTGTATFNGNGGRAVLLKNVPFP